MLHPPGIGVPDWPPPLRFALDSWPRMARTFEPYIAAHHDDREAWEALFDDQHRLDLFRSIHGNRAGKRTVPVGQLTLLGVAS